MALEQEDIAQVEAIVQRTLEEWQKSVGHANVRYELELHERIVRVEEELRHQRELMMEGFARMDKRFEQADKRIDTLTRRIDHFMVWSFATTLTVGGIVIGVLKFT